MHVFPLSYPLIILEWIRRRENDVRTLGELFYITVEEVRDIELADALGQLLSILENGINSGDVVLAGLQLCSSPGCEIG